MQPLEAFKLRILDHGRALQSVGARLSAIEVQEMAAAAVKSGLDKKEIRELQSLGAMGHQPGNAHRDMVRRYFSVLASPEPTRVKCDLVVKENGKQVEKELESWRQL